MARMRTLKIGFFANDRLAELPPLARLLFSGLWLIADREGRLENRPKRIKAEILPYDDCDITALLGQLEKSGFIECYEEQGIECVQIVNFAKHQFPNAKEPPSIIPKRASTCQHVPARESTCQHVPAQEGTALMGREQEHVQEQEGNIFRAGGREDDAFSSVEGVPDEATLVSALIGTFPQLDSLHREAQAMQRECVALCLRLKVTPDKVPKWREWLLAKWPMSNANPKKFLETLNQFLQEENHASSGRNSKNGRIGNANGIAQHDAGRFDATEF
jgi:hypothetical protein